MGISERGRWKVLGCGVLILVMALWGIASPDVPRDAPVAWDDGDQQADVRISDSGLRSPGDRRNAASESSSERRPDGPPDPGVTRIIGTFVEASTGAPVPSVRVELDGWISDQSKASKFAPWKRPEPVLSDSLGQFVLETVVRPGYGYALIGQRPGFGRVASRCDDLRWGEIEDYGVIQLSDDPWIDRVTVLDEHGAPKPEFEFVLDIGSRQFGESRRHRYHTHYGVTLRTDARGSVELGLPARSVQVQGRQGGREHWFDRDPRDGVLGVQTLNEAIRVRLRLGGSADESTRRSVSLFWMGAGERSLGERVGSDGDELVFWRRPGSPSSDLVVQGSLTEPWPDLRPGVTSTHTTRGGPVPVEWSPFEEAETVEVTLESTGLPWPGARGFETGMRFDVRVRGLLASRFGQDIEAGDSTVGLLVRPGDSSETRDTSAQWNFGESFQVHYRTDEPVGPIRLFFRVDGAFAELGEVLPVRDEVVEFEMPELDGWQGELHWPGLSGRDPGSAPQRRYVRAIRLSDSGQPMLHASLRIGPDGAIRPALLSHGRYLFQVLLSGRGRRDRTSDVVEIGSSTPDYLTIPDAWRTLRIRVSWSDGRRCQEENFSLQIPGNPFVQLYSGRTRVEGDVFVFERIPATVFEFRFPTPRLEWFRREIDVASLAEGEIVDVIVPVVPE